MTSSSTLPADSHPAHGHPAHGLPVHGLPVRDHRAEVARRKRETMRMRILRATMHVFARVGDDAPVIEDVVREAGIARGSFYKHFDSLDQALVAAGTEANDRMMSDILPIYDWLEEPWQRSAVGFRVFLVRAAQDPSWAAFVTRMDAWPHGPLISVYMSEDLRRGKVLGQFGFDDVGVANDFIMGASAGCIQVVRNGVADPNFYFDAAVRMLFQALGAAPELRERAVAFSRRHLAEWPARSTRRSRHTRPHRRRP